MSTTPLCQATPAPEGGPKPAAPLPLMTLSQRRELHPAPLLTEKGAGMPPGIFKEYTEFLATLDENPFLGAAGQPRFSLSTKLRTTNFRSNEI